MLALLPICPCAAEPRGMGLKLSGSNIKSGAFLFIPWRWMVLPANGWCCVLTELWEGATAQGHTRVGGWVRGVFQTHC